MEYLKLIKRTFVGSHLTEEEIQTALNNRNFIIKHFRRGEFLHLEGDECLCLEILLTGSIVSTQTDEYGTELRIWVFEVTQIIAGNILFGPEPKYPLSFLAESEGIVLQINKSFLFQLFVEKPVILRQFLSLISERAISLGSKIKLARRKPLRDNIMEYLHLQSLYQNSAIITLPISKTDLAHRFGVQRTSVSREFVRMERDGLIVLHDDNKTVEILDKWGDKK